MSDEIPNLTAAEAQQILGALEEGSLAARTVADHRQEFPDEAVEQVAARVIAAASGGSLPTTDAVAVRAVCRELKERREATARAAFDPIADNARAIAGRSAQPEPPARLMKVELGGPGRPNNCVDLGAKRNNLLDEGWDV